MAGLPFSVLQMHQFRGANASREKSSQIINLKN
jgi:hypothetical protein